MNAVIRTEMVDQPGTALASTANPYMHMLTTLVERGGDLSQLDKLLELQQKWEANEARKAFVAAMAAFKAEPMEILKRKVVTFETNSGVTSYAHAELADVTDVVVPAMGKHGLSHRWDVRQEGGSITVTCTITHELGHSESVSMTAAPDSSGKKNAIQQVASAITYLQRYTLLAITGMATKGMDDDSRTWGAETEAAVEVITEAQEIVLRDLLEAHVKNRPAFKRWIEGVVGYEITGLSQIPAQHFKTVHDELKRIAREAGNAP